MILGGYNPDRHEWDPLLQSWLYGGPHSPTFWLPHNAKMASGWCEYHEYSRQDGIHEMQEWRKKRAASKNPYDHPVHINIVFEGQVFDCDEWVASTAHLSHEEIGKLKTAPAMDVKEMTGVVELARRGVQIIQDGVNTLTGNIEEMEPGLEKLLKDMGLK